MPMRARGKWVDLPWFLTTSPAPVPDRVVRPRIDALMERSVAAYPATLVVAPSGYGKTSAVAQWAQHRPGTVWATAVAGLDPLHLVRGVLLQALPEVVRMTLLSLPGEEVPPSWEELVARITEPTTIVVDDAHLLDPHVLRSTLLSEPLLRSGVLRVVLVGQPGLTRTHARLLVGGLAGTVEARDLAFTVEETRTLLEGEGLDLGGADRLLRRTGGWPVAVRLLALTDLDVVVPGPAREDEPGELLADFVEQSVLAGLPAELADFVLAVTTCARVDVSLATALSGREDSGALLDRCVSAGLFIDRFGSPGPGQVHRWHETFAQAVRCVLERRDPVRAADLHVRAARVLADRFPTEAVHHALEAEDTTLAVEIVADSWLGMLLESQAATLDRLCLRLPEPYRDAPATLMVRACCADSLGESAVAQVLVGRARDAAPVAGPDQEFVLRFAEMLMLDEPSEKAAAADRCWELLPRVRPRQHAHALYAVSWVDLRLRRDLARAADQLGAVVRIAEAEGKQRLAASARANLGFALSTTGRFSRAVQVLGDASDGPAVVGWESFDGGLRSFVRGFAAFWRGELEEASNHFDGLVANTEDRNSFYPLGRVYHALTVSMLGRESAYAQAEYHLSLVPNEPRHGVPWQSYKRLGAAWLQAVRGRSEQALELTAPLPEHEGVPAVHALAAELHRRLGDVAGAGRLVARAASGLRVPYVQAQVYTTTALVHAANGSADEAHRYLERALDVAADEAACLPFVADDPLLATLLADHPRYGTRHEELLGAVALRRGRVRASTLPVLTARERELLGYLGTTMTTQEIADELHLSLNTVKTHFRSIYRKLGVNNRRSAAKLLG